MDLKLAEVFSDGMVLQAKKPIRVYGTGTGKVSISFLGETKKLESTTEKWCVEFDPQPYGGPYGMEIRLNENSVTLSDIMIGEVLLCAGQSNMALTLDATNTSPDLIGDDGLLRAYTAESVFLKDTGINDRWLGCATDTVMKWSALGYLIGRLYRKKYGCAVGIVVTAWGSSIIQSWIRREDYIGSELELPLEDLHRNYLVDDSWWNEPGYLYEHVLSGFLPYSFGSAVWYQGESNSGLKESKIYSELLAMFCNCLRREDMDERLPLCIVQIADFSASWIEQEAWDAIQAEQEVAAAKLKDAVLVISKDICETDDIHPRTKTKLAERIFEKLCLLKQA